MHLSNFRPVKRLTDVVEIFALVREKMPAKLVLIGDGPDRGAAEYIVRKKKISKDVHFLGKQDRVHEKLGVADLFLLPSDAESFGLAALEAMACEVPVVATNVGGLPEVVNARRGRLSFRAARCCTPARNTRWKFSSRPDRGRMMGEMARANARRKYCSNDIIPLYEAFYAKILNAAGASARA